MTSTAAQQRAYAGAPFFSFGFRPFFLSGALVAAFLPFVTALSLSGALETGAGYGPIAYHGHEMVYGYLGAIVAGFILTAIPNWTGQLPVMGWRLAALYAFWFAARLAIFFSDFIGPQVAAIIDAPFLVIMDIIMWREVITGKNWRNAPICVLMGLFAAGNLLWHFWMLSIETGMFGLRWGVAVIAILLALIGGRITPSFTRNWLVKSGRRPIEAPFGAIDKSSIALLAIAMIAWLIAPTHVATGALLLVAASVHLVRLLRWQGWRTTAEPLVAVLHIGYLWLPISLMLLGASALKPLILSTSIALHALTAGAAGVMTLAVMTRATLGHTGRELRANAVTVLIYILVNLGTLTRLAAPLAPAYYATTVAVASALWGAAFLLFAVVYGRYLLAPKLGAATPMKAR